MPKEELLTGGDLKTAYKKMKGFIVIHMPKKSIEKKTKIHFTSCKNLQRLHQERYGTVGEMNLGNKNKQQYWHYDTIKEIMIKYPNAKPCSKCKPTVH